MDKKSVKAPPGALMSSVDPEFSRRAFLIASSAVAVGGIGTMLTPLGNRALAAKKFEGRKVVFASWGGSYQDAEKVAYCDPFAEKTGATVLQDGPMNAAKFRTMVEAGAPVWDVVDVTDTFLYSAAKDNLLEEIDTSVVNVKRVSPEFVHKYGIGDIVWSYNLGYSTKIFNEQNHPRSWADLYDVKKFPGRRTLNQDVVPNLEIALLADGVPMDKLYPLDVERAFKKMSTLKEHVIFWQTNSQSQQLFIDGEVACGTILNGRAYDAVKKGGMLAIEWNQNIQSIDYLVVPKGAKNKELAMGLIDEMTVAENQAKVANLIAYSPTNKDAYASVDKQITPWLATSPQNAGKGFLVNKLYWQDHREKLNERFQEWKLA